LGFGEPQVYNNNIYWVPKGYPGNISLEKRNIYKQANYYLLSVNNNLPVRRDAVGIYPNKAILYAIGIYSNQYYLP
jgi:hypothetical protein